MNCPCGFGEPYDACCGRAHRGLEPATAAALMRARYSAFVLGDRDFLVQTWHSTTRPARLALEEDRRWTSLEILDQTAGGLFDANGTVEFVAHYRQHGKAGSQRENSRFVRHDGHWRYLGPQVKPSERER